MRKKVIAVLLSAAMTAALAVGCGGTGGSDGDAAGGTAEVEKIKIYVPTSGSTEDMDQVMEAVNEITIPEIGVEVEFTAYEFGQWFQQYSLFLSGTEDVDIMANYGGYLNAVSQGAAYDMTELLQEYGQDIIEVEGEDYLKSGQVDGTQYAIPIYATNAWAMGIIYRADVAEELGLTEQIAAVDSLEDWGEILAAVREAKPDMTPFVRLSGNTAPNFQYGTWDDLGNMYGVLMNPTESSEVVDLFETEEYAEMCGIMNDWYEQGYLSKDIQTQTDSFQVLTQNDAAFSTIGQVDFNSGYYHSTVTGKDIGIISLGEPVARTYSNVAYTIMSNTEHPEACMKFLNLWISNKELGTLVSYGIEGEHYQLDENGMGTYLDGEDATSCGFHMGSNLSNINRILWDTENPDYAELMVESNENSAKSVAQGFIFDTTSVTNEITQLDNICNKYQSGLECGALDPDTYLPEFIEELKGAGIEKVIEEKQSQLDAFLAN